MKCPFLKITVEVMEYREEFEQENVERKTTKVEFADCAKGCMAFNDYRGTCKLIENGARGE